MARCPPTPTALPSFLPPLSTLLRASAAAPCVCVCVPLDARPPHIAPMLWHSQNFCSVLGRRAAVLPEPETEPSRTRPAPHGRQAARQTASPATSSPGARVPRPRVQPRQRRPPHAKARTQGWLDGLALIPLEVTCGCPPTGRPATSLELRPRFDRCFSCVPDSLHQSQCACHHFEPLRRWLPAFSTPSYCTYCHGASKEGNLSKYHPRPRLGRAMQRDARLDVLIPTPPSMLA